VILTTQKRFFFSETRNPIERSGKKFDYYIGVELLLENIFELFSGPELGFWGVKIFF